MTTDYFYKISVSVTLTLFLYCAKGLTSLELFNLKRIAFCTFLFHFIAFLTYHVRSSTYELFFLKNLYTFSLRFTDF